MKLMGHRIRARCHACGKRIAPDAVSCPRCGEKNEWVHPEIQRFYDAQDDGEFDHLPPFEVTCDDGFLLEGKAFVKKTAAEYLPEFSWLCVTQFWKNATLGPLLLISVFGIIVFAAIFPAMVIVILAVNLLVFGYAFCAGWNEARSCKLFSVDLRHGEPRWWSNDDDFWWEIRTFFLEDETLTSDEREQELN